MIFAIINASGYNHDPDGDICFLGVNSTTSGMEKTQEWVTFLAPYLFGVVSGVCSLLFVFHKLVHGLGDVFSHAEAMVKDHVIFVSLQCILGIAWFILLL